ncbi:MAG TPA: hypothetical protein VF202_02545 [Trueperaceae bacterium]|jgi:hypothetical protein
MTASPRIGVFYEHPVWFEPLFDELARRGIAFDRILAHSHSFDPLETRPTHDLIVNRMSPSAFTRGHANAIPYTLEYLAHLDAVGAQVINGLAAYRYEFSKARQLQLMARLGVRHPRARVINHPSQAADAAEGLTFPVLVKPNVGGSGAGIRRFETPDELRRASEDGSIDLGLDHVGIVQEHLPARDASIVRVEVLGGRFLYAIRLRLESPTSFNLCPADYCRLPAPGEAAGAAPVRAVAAPQVATVVTAPGEAAGAVGSVDEWVPVEGYSPPREAIDTVLRLTRAAHIEVGGVEYLVNDRDGEVYYYDVNALSNFVANAPDVVGFDPFPRLVDYIEQRAGLRAAAAD